MGSKRSMPKNMDAYLARVPEPARSTLKKVCATIRSVVPPETTEGISYGIPTFKYKGGLVAFAAFKNHCSFFPMGSSVLDSFEKELKDFRVSKGTLRFPLDKPLPPTLVKKIVMARIAQNENKRGR
jgi:uncharacterized protein YdhG (YjbR/CyaY superfamily)